MLLQNICQETAALLQDASVVLLGAAACCLYFQMKTLLKMVEASMSDLLPGVPYDPPKSDIEVTKAPPVCPNQKQRVVSG